MQKLTTSVMLLIFILTISINAKTQKIDTTTRHRLEEIEKLYKGSLRDGDYVTSYVLDSLIQGLQRKMSGTTIKDGKVNSTTASVEEKSISLNYNLTKDASRKLFVQATVEASSEDNFVDIFSGGKYQRTITGGFNFNFFPALNSGNYLAGQKYKLWGQLQTQNVCYKNNREKIRQEKIALLMELKYNYDACKNEIFIEDRKSGVDTLPNDNQIACQCTYQQKVRFFELLKKLEAYYPEDFDTEDANSVGIFIDSINYYQNAFSFDLADRENLNILDSIQHNAPWTQFKLNWWSGSLKFNQKTHPIFDPAASDDIYTSNFYEGYVSASISFNRMKIRNKNDNIGYFSPTISYNNARDFDEDSLLTMQKQEDFRVNPTTTLKMIDATAFYREKAKRKDQFGFELPYIIYYPKSGYGIDLGAGIKFSDEVDDVYARFGVYIPISTGDDDVVTIEPIIKVSKINKSEKSFLKDMVSFGFNISVTIPKFLKEDK